MEVSLSKWKEGRKERKKERWRERGKEGGQRIGGDRNIGDWVNYVTQLVRSLIPDHGGERLVRPDST